MIKFTCPGCKRILSADDKMAGKKAKCPHCQNVGAIPRLPGSPAAPPPAAGVSAPPKSVAVAPAKAPVSQAAAAPAPPPPSAPETADVEALAADTFIDKP